MPAVGTRMLGCPYDPEHKHVVGVQHATHTLICVFCEVVRPQAVLAQHGYETHSMTAAIACRRCTDCIDDRTDIYDVLTTATRSVNNQSRPF